MFLISEITTLEPMSTKVVASPIPMALLAMVVTAREGQVPSSSTMTGFSLIRPLSRMER